MHDFEDVEGVVRADLVGALRRDWDRLASPGSVWDGQQRVEIARLARAGADATGTIVPGAVGEAAWMINHKPAQIRSSDIERWLGEGIDMAGYVEIVGVVSRLSATDTIHRALGSPPEPLPTPRDGTPSGDIAGDARMRRAWVPMVGGMSIVTALSLVPDEMAAMADYHGPAYLTLEQMGEPDFQRGLHRSQMELVAARTSAINECFY